SGLGDVGRVPPPGLPLGLLAAEDPLGDPDGLLRAPELHILLRQAPVELLDRADTGHDLGPEPREVGVGARRPDGHGGGDARARRALLGPGRLESPDRGARAASRLDADDLGVVQADADGLGDRHGPGLANEYPRGGGEDGRGLRTGGQWGRLTPALIASRL